jgi:hypothetical protein
MTIRRVDDRISIPPPQIEPQLHGPRRSRRFTSVCEEIYEHARPAQLFGGEAA